MYGWAGKILRVNLSEEKISKQTLPRKLKTSFLGGRGINVKILFNEVRPFIDAFDPENRLIFGTGPLTGTLAPGGSRFNVTTRSPLGFLGDSNSGGHWGPELKFAGYDHIVIRGRAEKPVYLWIHDDDVEIINAKDLWGKNTWETQRILREELKDPEIQTVCIGQAGENLVRFACVRTGLKDAAGRTGTGAVMGAKNLKAIAVRGTQEVKIAEPERFLEACKKLRQRIEDPDKYIGGIRGGSYEDLWFIHNFNCMLNTRHHQSGCWEEADKLDPQIFHRKYVVRMVGCFSCAKPCMPYFEIEEGPFKGLYGEGPEFEPVASFGSATAVSDLPTVLKASIEADKYGLDNDSCGRVISFAMELFQRNIISEKDIGFPLIWGDGKAMLKLIGMIAKREGFGDILAEGEVRAGKMIGKEAEKYVLAIKNVEEHETLRAARGLALSQATSTRGSDHLRSTPHVELYLPPEIAKKVFGHESAVDRLSYDYKPSTVIMYEYQSALPDMLGVCKRFSFWQSVYYTEDIFAEIFSSATGVKMDGAELLKAAERAYNVERAFLVREGLRRKDDYPTWRDFEDPLPSGNYKGQKLDRKKYDKMLDEYYRLHGWDVKTGIPTRKKLKELGLTDVMKEIPSR